MEQQEQRALQKQAPKQEHKQKEAAQRQMPQSSWIVQAIADGAAVWDLPRKPLEALAEHIGNSSMLALMEMQSPAAELRQQPLRIGVLPELPATEVPQMDCPLVPAMELTAGSWPTGASDPGSLE